MTTLRKTRLGCTQRATSMSVPEIKQSENGKSTRPDTA